MLLCESALFRRRVRSGERSRVGEVGGKRERCRRAVRFAEGLCVAGERLLSGAAVLPAPVSELLRCDAFSSPIASPASLAPLALP